MTSSPDLITCSAISGVRGLFRLELMMVAIFCLWAYSIYSWIRRFKKGSPQLYSVSHMQECFI